MIKIKTFKKSKTIFFILFIVVSILFSSCSEVSENDFNKINSSVEKTNLQNKYKASFVFEVRDTEKEELVMFVQGTYSLDKFDEKYSGPILSGEIVQTVLNTPSSMKIAFYDDTYVSVSDGYKILSDMDKDLLLNQFMCAPAYLFSMDKLISIDSSEVSGGTMYTVKADDDKNLYLQQLLGDDIYSFSGMKKPQKDLTKYSDIVFKYVISEENLLLSRETTYTVFAYDTVPYSPAHQGTNEDYKRTFSVSLKLNYKSFGDDVFIDISDFLPDDSSENVSE